MFNFDHNRSRGHLRHCKKFNSPVTLQEKSFPLRNNFDVKKFEMNNNNI